MGALRSTSTAIAGTQPNLRDSGHSAPSPSVSTRQNTRAPGATRRRSSPTSSTQSTANRSDAEFEGALAMSRSFLMVLPKEMRSAGGTRVHRHLADSRQREAVSKDEPSSRQAGAGSPAPGSPSPRRKSRESGSAFSKARIIVAHDLEVDDEARAPRVVGWRRKSQDALGSGHGRRLPSRRKARASFDTTPGHTGLAQRRVKQRR